MMNIKKLLTINKKIDWLNHLLEFLVVLIGILIAFQLNKYSENKSKSNLIKNHLDYVKLECQENEKELDIYLQQINKQIEYCDSLLLEISSTKNLIIIRDLSTKLLDLRNIDLSRNAYEVLTQSGDIRFLKDYDLKREIISLYDSFKNVDKINQSNQNLYDSHFYPYLKSNFDLVNWKYVDIKSKNDKELYYSKEFANIISTYRYLLLAKQNIYLKEKKMIGEYLNE